MQSDNYFITRNGAVLLADDNVSKVGIVEGDELTISPDPVGGARLPQPLWEMRLKNEVDDIEGLEGIITLKDQLFNYIRQYKEQVSIYNQNHHYVSKLFHLLKMPYFQLLIF